MDRNTLSKQAAGLIFLIFALNFLAKKFYWYSTIWFFDMPMHFLGGFWLAFLFFWFWRPSKPSVYLTLQAISAILIVGVSWEIFELVFDGYVAQNPFNVLDTLSDLCFDLAGGLSAIAYLYFKIGTTEQTRL